jgi:rhamnogalacturonyl hydrolase YesR
VAISGRLRLRAIDDDYPDPAEDITTLVNFLTKDEGFDKNSNSGPNLAAMCWTEELYESSNDTKWKELLIKAANTYEKVPKGISPKPCHPDFGCEDMFFISAILGRAFKATDDISYVNAFVDFLLEAKVQQDDGLFWHSRTTPYFWGRGNGFSALAYSEALTYMPNNYPQRKQILDIHTRHLAGMINNQLPNGTWSQLIDLPGTYQELSVTCMVGYALARGIRKGWLDKSFIPALEKTWSAAKKRISDNGDLVDVCSGTGFQQKRSDYIYRKAEYGYDDRGGSMAIWFSTEMALLEENN